jgi:hypothetical protein
MPPRNVTELVPLPAHPAQVKVPDVVNVTGSAFAVEAPIAMKPASIAAITIVFINRAMFLISPLSTFFDLGRTSTEPGVWKLFARADKYSAPDMTLGLGLMLFHLRGKRRWITQSVKLLNG